MAKLTKAQSRLHQDACNLLARPLSSPLTPTEKEFILTHWDPSANHINSVAGAYFTPLELAWDLAHEAQTDGSVVDLCAGIGTLAYCMRNQGWPGQQKAHADTVCIEINPAYVEVGRRILPEALWICLDVFKWARDRDDRYRLRERQGALTDALIADDLYDIAIANPPFGFPQSPIANLPLKGVPLDLNVLAVARKVARSATFILSSSACPFEYSGRQGYAPRPSRHFDKFSQQTGIQSDSLCCASVDCAIYRDKWRGVMPNIELVSVDFTINDDPDEQQRVEGEETMDSGDGNREQEQEHSGEEQEHGESLPGELEQASAPGEGDDEKQDDPLGGGENAVTPSGGGLLSLADIERMTDISYVTLCRYAQQYADELPSEGTGRKKRYYPEAVAILVRKRAESTKGRKPAGVGGAVTDGQKPAKGSDVLEDAPDGSIIRPLSPRRHGRPAGKKAAQKKVAGKSTQKKPSKPARGGSRISRQDSTPSTPVVSSASTLAMDRAVRELEIAQHVTRLEALKWGIAPVQAEIERLEKLIAQAQGRGGEA